MSKIIKKGDVMNKSNHIHTKKNVLELNEENLKFLKEFIVEQYTDVKRKYDNHFYSVMMDREMIRKGEYRKMKKTIERDNRILEFLEKQNNQLESLVQDLGITIEN